MSVTNLASKDFEEIEMSGGALLVKEVAKKTLGKSVSDGFFYYFGYGSNLLKERIQVQIKDAVFESTGVLSGYELSFYDSSKRWFGGIASIEMKEISKVYGCIWKVPNSFAAELDLQESGYHRIDVNVQVLDKNGSPNEILCRTYQWSNPSKKRLPPSPHYKYVIVSGAIEHKLPEEYIKTLTVIQDNGYKGKVALDLNILKELNKEIESDKERGG